MTVKHGYVLADGDYPELPEIPDYAGYWEKYTKPITEDITILGGYRSAYHTVTFIANTSISSDISMIAAQPSKTTTITVADGYVLKDSDYPAMPKVEGYQFTWDNYRSPITKDITIQGKYEKVKSIDPPKPPVETITLPGGDSQGDVQPLSTGTLESTVVEKHSYVYNGSQLTQETITTKTTTGTSTTTTTEVLYYAYDASGTPMSVEYTNASGTKTTYYYAVNIQGDVTAILNTSGTAVVTYTYDAWGNPLTATGPFASTLGEINSLRYRGYVYDGETGYYYLQSRYYNPELGRFINADACTSTGQGLLGSNMFTYCYNNPTNYFDASGDVPQAVEDKWVHDEVLKHICSDEDNKDLSWKGTCIYYNGMNIWGGFGYCDLYNKRTGEVWELKKDSTSYSCLTSTALAQLDRYINGRLKHQRDLDLRYPYITEIKSNTFTFQRDGYIYAVEYWSEGNGILRYSYTRKETDARKALETAAMTALSLILYLASQGAVDFQYQPIY